MNAIFSIHYDGPIVVDHKVPVRVMAKTYEHMQRAIDRAYLAKKYGEVWKHARLKQADYSETEFFAEYPREGGIILDGFKAGAASIIDRINSAILKPFEKALELGSEEHGSMLAELPERKAMAHANQEHLATYEDMLAQPDPKIVRAYSDRSIAKEIDQVTSMIRSEGLAESHVNIGLIGSHASTYEFNAERARRFHAVVSRRQLGEPVLIRGKIRLLDNGNKHGGMKAKILNLDSGREVTLFLASRADFLALHPYHTAEEILLFACPVIEFGAYDPNGGDMYFVDIAE